MFNIELWGGPPGGEKVSPQTIVMGAENTRQFKTKEGYTGYRARVLGGPVCPTGTIALSFLGTTPSVAPYPFPPSVIPPVDTGGETVWVQMNPTKNQFVLQLKLSRTPGGYTPTEAVISVHPYPLDDKEKALLI